MGEGRGVRDTDRGEGDVSWPENELEDPLLGVGPQETLCDRLMVGVLARDTRDTGVVLPDNGCLPNEAG